MPGYNLINDYCYRNCPSNCLNCNIYTGVCLKCYLSYSLDTNVNKCTSCAAGCAVCNLLGNCSSCLPNFVYNYNSCTCPIQGANSTCECSQNYTISINNTCIPDGGIFGCIQLNSFDISQCSVCNPKFQLINGLSCQPTCVIDSCLNCSVIGFCSQCNLWSSPSTSGETCISCWIGNCRSCKQSYVCSYCSFGYSLSSDGSNCYYCPDTNCLQCSSNYICQSCVIGFMPNANGSSWCISCPSPCATCYPNSTCATCLWPFSSTPNSIGICYLCSIPNC